MKRQRLTAPEKEQLAFLITLRNRYLEQQIQDATLPSCANLEWFRVQVINDRAELRKNKRIKAKLGYPDTP